MDIENVPIDAIVEQLNGKADSHNGNGIENGKHSPPNAMMKKPSPPSEGKKRSKKVVRQNSREGLQSHPLNGALNGCFVVPQRRWKNSRRSRSGYGRGLPKKNGGGGKGVWGLPGSEILEEEEILDRNDPNYDPEVNDRNIQLSKVVPETTPEDFFKLIEPIILEYFEHGKLWHLDFFRRIWSKKRILF